MVGGFDWLRSDTLTTIGQFTIIIERQLKIIALSSEEVARSCAYKSELNTNSLCFEIEEQ